MTQEENLLNRISSLMKTYSLMRKHSGVEFNIFEILQIVHYEVTTHSRMIAELLNPAGTHGQDDLFLKLFLNEFASKQFEFDTIGATVEVEKSVGETTETTGGRIDIIVRDRNGNLIIIENKIYADDQPNQLLRYYNYAIKSGRDFEIIYLTLYGDAVNDKASGGNEFVKACVSCNSYKENTIRWLEECRNRSATKPAVREIITQYIDTIKELTGTSIYEDENMAIAEEIMKSPENIAAFFKLLESQNAVRDAVQKKFVEQIEMVAKEFGFFVKVPADLNQQYADIEFRLNESSPFYFQFQFAGSNMRDLEYGILHHLDQKPSDEQVKKIQEVFNMVFGEQKCKWPNEYNWVSFTQWLPYRSRWDSNDRALKICDGTFAKDLRVLLSQAREILENQGYDQLKSVCKKEL